MYEEIRKGILELFPEVTEEEYERYLTLTKMRELEFELIKRATKELIEKKGKET